MILSSEQSRTSDGSAPARVLRRRRRGAELHPGRGPLPRGAVGAELPDRPARTRSTASRCSSAPADRSGWPPAGELLLPRARRILAELDVARAELAALAGRAHRPAAARHDRQRRGRRARGRAGPGHVPPPAPRRGDRHPGHRQPAHGRAGARRATSTSPSSACSPTRCRRDLATACWPSSRWSPSSPRGPPARRAAPTVDLAELAARRPVRRDAGRVRVAPAGRRSS